MITLTSRDEDQLVINTMNNKDMKMRGLKQGMGCKVMKSESEVAQSYPTL